ncbi:MAG: hypothetical protein R3F37_02645 [Candidatus Competibacteraceae bacterium]
MQDNVKKANNPTMRRKRNTQDQPVIRRSGVIAKVINSKRSPHSPV